MGPIEQAEPFSCYTRMNPRFPTRDALLHWSADRFETIVADLEKLQRDMESRRKRWELEDAATAKGSMEIYREDIT